MTLILVILFPILWLASLFANILIAPLNLLAGFTVPQWFYWGLLLSLFTWSLRER